MKQLLAGLAWVLFAAIQGCPLLATDVDPLAGLKFLEGKWIGEGSSEVGKGSGYASFERDLQGKVVVRRNHAEYPGSEGKPAYVHDDLMVIYADTAAQAVRAFYTDNEGHVIHYTVSISADGNAVTFLGDAEPGAPRYRLGYVRIGINKMSILLEQGTKGTEFHKIVEGRVVKQ
jgi:hypothetical protein